MGSHHAPQARLPEPIPASYYVRGDGGRPEEARPAGAVAALGDAMGDAWRRWPGGRTARALAGSTLAGGLLAGALIVLLFHALASPHGGRAASRPPPTTPAASPPQPYDSPFPAAQTPDDTPRPSPRTSPTARPTPSPSVASVTFLNAPLSAHRGRSVRLQARTTPGTACSIDLGYASAPLLDPATADAGGEVSWSWRVAGPAPSGTWPVTVTCGGISATTRLVIG